MDRGRLVPFGAWISPAFFAEITDGTSLRHSIRDVGAGSRSGWWCLAPVIFGRSVVAPRIAVFRSLVDGIEFDMGADFEAIMAVCEAFRF